MIECLPSVHTAIRNENNHNNNNNNNNHNNNDSNHHNKNYTQEDGKHKNDKTNESSSGNDDTMMRILPSSEKKSGSEASPVAADTSKTANDAGDSQPAPMGAMACMAGVKNTGRTGATVVPFKRCNETYKRGDGVDNRWKGTFLPDHFKPTVLDVLCGRGKECYNHEGNRNFRRLVETSLPRYAKCRTKHEKGMLVVNIVDGVRSKGGGFVRFDTKASRWLEIGDDAAREKVGQTIREALIQQDPEKRTRKRQRRALNKQRRKEIQKEKDETTPVTSGTDEIKETNIRGISKTTVRAIKSKPARRNTPVNVPDATDIASEKAAIAAVLAADLRRKQNAAEAPTHGQSRPGDSTPNKISAASALPPAPSGMMFPTNPLQTLAMTAAAAAATGPLDQARTTRMTSQVHPGVNAAAATAAAPRPSSPSAGPQHPHVPPSAAASLLPMGLLPIHPSLILSQFLSVPYSSNELLLMAAAQRRREQLLLQDPALLASIYGPAARLRTPQPSSTGSSGTAAAATRTAPTASSTSGPIPTTVTSRPPLTPSADIEPVQAMDTRDTSHTEDMEDVEDTEETEEEDEEEEQPHEEEEKDEEDGDDAEEDDEDTMDEDSGDEL